MIVLFHHNNKVVEVLDWELKTPIESTDTSVSKTLVHLATRFPERLLLWCNTDFKNHLDYNRIKSMFHHKRMLVSYNPESNYLSEDIGYIDASVFANVNKNVTYATWQTASAVGGVASEVILKIKKKLILDDDFDYFLNSFGKLIMHKGIFCISEPKLVSDSLVISSSNSKKASNYRLFKFTGQHYKKRWVLLLFLNILLYQKKILILQLFYGLCFKNRMNHNVVFNEDIVSKEILENKNTLDVIIPTIGRKKYLYDFLKDLANQTIKPTKVIIVEQNPDEGSTSDLDFLVNETWPFAIKHIFTNQAGVCNARNLALKEVENNWVFFADDDIRIKDNFIELAFQNITKVSAEAVSFNCLLKNQKPEFSWSLQWPTFGSGCSFVLAEKLKDCKFRMGFEFGFGEDGDFGIQLRNKGVDILFLPTPEILHIKAPMGGFRTRPEVAWRNEVILPKPSPTVMLFNLLNSTKQQHLGYKTLLFFKYYKHQSIKNPIRYYNYLSKQWKVSEKWAFELMKKND